MKYVILHKCRGDPTAGEGYPVVPHSDGGCPSHLMAALLTDGYFDLLAKVSWPQNGQLPLTLAEYCPVHGQCKATLSLH